MMLSLVAAGKLVSVACKCSIFSLVRMINSGSRLQDLEDVGTLQTTTCELRGSSTCRNKGSASTVHYSLVGCLSCAVSSVKLHWRHGLGKAALYEAGVESERLFRAGTDLEQAMLAVSV